MKFQAFQLTLNHFQIKNIILYTNFRCVQTGRHCVFFFFFLLLLLLVVTVASSLDTSLLRLLLLLLLMSLFFFPYTLNQNEKHSTWYSVKRNGIELYFYGLHYTGKSVWFELLIALALFICTKTMEPFPNTMWINFYWVKISLASTQSRWKQLFVWCCLVCAVASFEARARERVHQNKMRFILFVISRCFFLLSLESNKDRLYS